MSGAVYGNLAVNMFVQGSLNHLWSMINSLQLTLTLPTINVNSPSNVQYFTGLLLDVTQFDIVPEFILESAYLWKLFDGTYLKNSDDEEEILDEDQSEGRLLKEVKGKKEVEGDENSIERGGYGSISSINNMGSTFFYCIIFCFEYVLMKLYGFCARKVKSKKKRLWFLKKKK